MAPHFLVGWLSDCIYVFRVPFTPLITVPSNVSRGSVCRTTTTIYHLNNAAVARPLLLCVSLSPLHLKQQAAPASLSAHCWGTSYWCGSTNNSKQHTVSSEGAFTALGARQQHQHRRGERRTKLCCQCHTDKTACLHALMECTLHAAAE